MSTGREHVDALQGLLNEAQLGLTSLGAIVDSLEVLIAARNQEKPAEPVAVTPPPGDPLLAVLAEPGLFFDHVRAGKLLGPQLTIGEVEGCKAIMLACAGWPISYVAYALGTAYLETAGTMQPIKEIGGKAYFTRMYDIEGNRPAKARELGNTVPGDGAMFPGRGYVQLTGRKNYLKASTALQSAFPGLDLIAHPEDAMKPPVAAAIMRRGMEEGWFTGKKLADYLPASGKATTAQFKEARRIINGTDRWEDIAAYSGHFQEGLTKGGWKAAA